MIIRYWCDRERAPRYASNLSMLASMELAAIVSVDHRMTHFFFVFSLVGLGFSTALVYVSLQLEHVAIVSHVSCTHRIASSKTLFRFLCVSAEHSKYLTALMSLATDKACSYETGSIFFDLSPSAVALSSLRSSFVPTSIIGTLGAWCSISGCHCFC